MLKLLKSFAVAFSMYSKIPMPRFEWASEDMKYHLIFFPLVGAVTGGLEIFWLYITRSFGLNGILSLCVSLAVPLLVTGGFHMDGFLDTSDALHSYGEKEKKLEILKDPHIGAFAVISLVIYFLLAAGFGSVILEKAEKYQSAASAVAFSFVLSRILSGISVTYFPKAKKDGMLAVESSSSDKTVVGIVLIVEFFAAAGALLSLTLQESFCGIAVIFVMLLVFCWYFFMSRKEFGGINGDLAGFFVCVSELGAVIASGLCILVTEFLVR